VVSAIVSFKTRAVPEKIPIASVIQVELDNGRVLSLTVRLYLFLANLEKRCDAFKLCRRAGSCIIKVDRAP